MNPYFVAGSQSPNLGSQDHQVTTEELDDAIIQKLSGEEEADEAQLNELMAKISEMRMKAVEEEMENVELEEYCRGLRGRIAAIEQSTEELGVEHLKGMLVEAEEEYENAKFEYSELTREMLQKSESVVSDVHGATNEIEDIRIQFTSPGTLNKLVQKEEEKLCDIAEEMKAMDGKAEETEASIDNLKLLRTAFGDADLVLEYLQGESFKLDLRIDKTLADLATKRGDHFEFP